MTTQTLERETQAISLESVISGNMRVALAMRNKNQSDLSRAFGVSRTLISQIWKKPGNSLELHRPDS